MYGKFVSGFQPDGDISNSPMVFMNDQRLIELTDNSADFRVALDSDLFRCGCRFSVDNAALDNAPCVICNYVEVERSDRCQRQQENNRGWSAILSAHRRILLLFRR
jgi:hypothetical protein